MPDPTRSGLSTATPGRSREPHGDSAWIVSPRYDLAWFVGASIVSYVYLYALFGLGISIVLLWWVFTCFFDVPHLFATFVRTYFDRQERKKRRRLLLGSLLWFVIGPVCILLGMVLGTRGLFSTFVAFWIGYTWYHVFRQHYGFMVLYQKKNGEPSGVENRIDYYCYHYTMIVAFLAIILENPSLRPSFGLPPDPTASEAALVSALSITLLVSVTLLFGQQLHRYATQRTINAPKLLFLAATLSFPLFLCFSTFGEQVNYLMLAASVTIFHNIQYHGIVWFYSQSRYRALPRDDSVARYGLAARVTSNFALYLGVCTLLALAWRYMEWLPFGSPFPFTPEQTALRTVSLGHLFNPMDLAFAFFVGLSLQHNFLDQFIWRLSRDEDLTRDLGVGEGAIPVQPAS